MDIEKLIEQLSARGLSSGSSLGYHSGLFDEASTALSTLQAENEKLRDENRRWSEATKTLSCAIENLRAELEQVKQERDEAVQCIRGIAKSGRVWMCPYCVHAKDTTGGIAECELDVGVCMMPYSKFEWRGPHKED